MNGPQKSLSGVELFSSFYRSFSVEFLRRQGDMISRVRSCKGSHISKSFLNYG